MNGFTVALVGYVALSAGAAIGCGGATQAPQPPAVKQTVVEGAAASDQSNDRQEQREMLREQAEDAKKNAEPPPKEDSHPLPRPAPSPPPK